MQPRLHRNPDLVGVDLGIVLSDRQAWNANLEHVLAVDGKIVPDRNAGARIERQIVAEPFVPHTLHRVALGIVNLFDRLYREVADRQPADAARRRHVALEQRRRCRQDGRDVVEAVSGIVHGQPFARPHVDRQQISNGIAVLGAVQPVHRRASRIGSAGRRAIEIELEEIREGLSFFGLWAISHVGRRHFAGADLPKYFLPHFSAGGHVRHVGVLQRETAGLELVVVAAQARPVHQRRVRSHVGWRRFLGLRNRLPVVHGRTKQQAPTATHSHRLFITSSAPLLSGFYLEYAYRSLLVDLNTSESL